MSDSNVLSVDDPKVAEFASRVGLMKPNAVKKGNTRAEEKLDKLLDDPSYALEEKIDGCHYKMIGHRFFSIDNIEKTANFPHLTEFFRKLSMQNLILDGEINYPGKTSQYCLHVTGPLPNGARSFQEQNGYIHYTIFDILRTPKGNWTLRNTYLERRKLLEYFYDTFVRGTPMEQYIHLVDMRIDNKREYLEGLLSAGREGGVLKKLDSQYFMGKKPMWVWMKIKQEDLADLVIMGFDPPAVEYRGSNLSDWPYWQEINGVNTPVTKYHYHGWIGSVVLGAYVNGSLTRICSASGISEEIRKDMSENPDKYLHRVARVSFMEKTSDGYPRHPVFVNMHETKQPHECTWEF